MASGSLEEIARQIEALQAETEELRLAERIEQLRIVVEKYEPVPPTIRNPINDAAPWTGRGRKPRWPIAALKAGKTNEPCRHGRSAHPTVMEVH